MKVALDVSYDQQNQRAGAAAVGFCHWSDASPCAEWTASLEAVQPYVPGQFYRRELPCLVAVLGKVREAIDLVLIDGYVQLGERPGLGRHLWEALARTCPVVGVAKSPFRAVGAVEVFRGKSTRPLYVTAVGIDQYDAAEKIKRMHGRFRIPTLLKRADALARRQGLHREARV